ncbi:hypothetical protein AB0P21_00790 [Kribbella sp. NPDC056861]|uniref:hypothetical protein n=1 Tax=Kribbella sp. NPDC056861 TaxID=3154857 RepID=UPI00343E218C
MTTTVSQPPSGQTVTAQQRARQAIGAALGIVSPTAVPLRDGRVRLTGSRDYLPAAIVEAADSQLSRRAADHVSDQRLLAEAVAMLGAEIARTRGNSPAEGATAALDRLLHVPGLDQPRRDEAQAMLRVALQSAAPESEAAAVRLTTMPTEPRPPVTSEIVSAAHQISREARTLQSNPGTALPPPGQPRVSGRHRAQVGGSHRRAEARTQTPEVRGTSLVSGIGGRPALDPDLQEDSALAALQRLGEADLGSSVTSQPTVLGRPRLAVLDTTASEAPQHFRVEILQPGRGLAAEGRLRSGTQNDPHVLRISPRLADAQLRQVWVHQLSQLTQELEAAKAGRPKGILARVRAVFSHEKRDRRLNADYASYQLLANDWHEARAETAAYGRPSGPRSVADLERDLEGLATSIGKRGGATPTLPWAEGSIYAPGASIAGVAAAAAERDAVAARPAPNSPGLLRERVLAEMTTLQSAVFDLEVRAADKVTTATAATEAAGKSKADAEAEKLLKDNGAPERARQLEVAADASTAKARRHTEIAAAYQHAAGEAAKTLDGYQALLGELDAAVADTNRSQDQIPELARQAAERADAYQASVDQAMPVKDLLGTGVPTGQPLAMPVDEINQVLASQGSKEQIAPGAPIPVPGAEYRRLLSPDGMVFTVGGSADDDVTKLTQVRLRMKARDLTEVIGRDYDLAEQMTGTMGDGGQSIATIAAHSASVNAGVDLQPFMALAPDGTAVRAASHVVAPRIDGSSGRSLEEASGAQAAYQHSMVDDNRGESLLYEWTGDWEIEVRNSVTKPWSPVETVEAGRQLTWMSSAYTVQAPAETVSLEEVGRANELSTEFPRYTVNRVTGLQGLNDELVAKARDQHGRIDRNGYDHISGLITQDAQRLLREASKPGGVSRPVPNGGEPEYELNLTATPVWSTARLVGESSREVWQEEVVVDFAGINASQTFNRSLSGSVSVGPTTLQNLGSTSADLSPSIGVGRNVSRQGGQDVSATSITPAVHRNQGPTQAVVVDWKLTATLTKISDRKAQPVVVTKTCEALVRLPDNDLLRAGGRADKRAIQTEPDGTTIRQDQDGHALLHGDPEPPTGPQTLPPWYGTGENQLRGPGKALTQSLQGADEAQRQALTSLSQMKLVPPLDADFRPRLDALPSDERQRAAQLMNYDRVVQQITAPRMEAGINQACQGGLPVVLVEHRLGRAPHFRQFRLAVEQDFTAVEGRGTTNTENVVRLGIGSDATGRSSGRSKSLPLSAGVGVSNGPTDGVRGLAGRLGAKLSRNAVGRSFNWSVNRRVNRVTLNESTAPLDKLKQDIRITFTEMTDQGGSKPLADVRGTMTLAIDSALTRAEQPAFEAQPKQPHPAAVQRGIPVAVDAGNPADRLVTAVPAIRADSSAYLQLHTALSPDSLIAHPEWMNGKYELPLVITPAPANPVQAVQQRGLLPQQHRIVIRGEAIAQTVVATSAQNTGDINFTMNTVGAGSGTSTSGGVGVDGGGGQNGADGSSLSGSLGAGRNAGSSQSTSSSQTTGEERLLVNVGTHYELIERYRMVADVMDGDRVVQSVPLEDAIAQKAMAERRALELYGTGKLDLPLPMVTDAAERYLNGKLDLSPRTAAGFVRRYRLEKAGATGLAESHTDERLTQKVLEKSGVQQSNAPTAAERLDAAVEDTELQANQPRAVGLPPQYLASLGSSQLESITVEGQPDKKVDLLPLVRPQIEEVAPGLQAESALLGAALKVDLGEDSYQGALENMFGPRGYVAPIEVPVEGRESPDLLLVRVKARYEGDITVDGNPEISKEDLIGIIQAYDYNRQSKSVGHSTTYSASVGGKDADADGTALNVGVGTDRTRSVSAESGSENTTIDRALSPELAKVQRTVLFTTEVTRVHNAGAATMASLRWRLNQVNPAERITVSTPAELRAQLTALVPRRLITAPLTAAQAAPDERLPEHREFHLPESAIVQTMVPYPRGGDVTDQLYDEVSARLGRSDMLNDGGLLEYQAAVESQLAPTAMKAKFEQLTSADGLALVPMATPGNGRTTISVVVKARPLGWELEGDVQPEGQTGKVRRHQLTTRTTTAGNRLLPVAGSGGASGGIVSVGGSVGEQVKQQQSDAHGTRLETSKFEEGELVVVRIPVAYDVTVTKSTDKGRGTPAAKRPEHLPNVARAEYYVAMLKHEYLDGLRQLESGASVDAVVAGARLQAVPERLGSPDIRATEYGQDKSGQQVHQPYRPLLDALAKAKSSKEPVVLSVREADGHERLYQAFPNGTMAGVNDGGYGSAFATLHPTMALMAEGRVDLRELYNTGAQQGEFSSKVADALVQSGVPASMLKGLDYSTTARQLAPTAGQGGRHVAAARTITASEHGPSIAGS